MEISTEKIDNENRIAKHLNRYWFQYAIISVLCCSSRGGDLLMDRIGNDNIEYAWIVRKTADTLIKAASSHVWQVRY
jgi:hypothetical protein